MIKRFINFEISICSLCFTQPFLPLLTYPTCSTKTWPTMPSPNLFCSNLIFLVLACPKPTGPVLSYPDWPNWPPLTPNCPNPTCFTNPDLSYPILIQPALTLLTFPNLTCPPWAVWPSRGGGAWGHEPCKILFEPRKLAEPCSPTESCLNPAKKQSYKKRLLIDFKKR